MDVVVATDLGDAVHSLNGFQRCPAFEFAVMVLFHSF
jgi:hypothetical protein